MNRKRITRTGALDRGGGVATSPVDFKKYQCHMSLSLIYSHVACQIQEIGLSHVTIFLEALPHVDRLHVACQISEIAVSLCRI